MNSLSNKSTSNVRVENVKNDNSDEVNKCDDYNQTNLNRITEEDISKLLKGNPILSRADIIQKLPLWLRDLSEAFLPQEADKLPPNRVWDHKIELVPGKEPAYYINRPLS
ncbi:hypothetical protein K3495_g2339 [Podosphaera aphanis]|nr:hypothetical protein K3495_g2339 [Podosphaera aphanis]